MQLAPSEVVARVQRFPVDALRVDRAAAGERGDQVAAAQPGRRCQARRVEQRRQQIDVLSQCGDARPRARFAGSFMIHGTRMVSS